MSSLFCDYLPIYYLQRQKTVYVWEGVYLYTAISFFLEAVSDADAYILVVAYLFTVTYVTLQLLFIFHTHRILGFLCLRYPTFLDSHLYWSLVSPFHTPQPGALLLLMRI